ncbi:haloacid dehalogenase [Psychromonas marina]|uniref:Haloacid dehalogenase n=1 Tax=Psychromonas marina TaxID=88364 RepID=A0ABQ6E2K2_9GAMM|nr:Cof-type HAD-IIB family hydrolase [Psychromonas marina]GLS91408.1 haloacid dehalogenase [Psychromonas marina]
MIKLIALDMDGTLLNKEKLVSERNCQAIQRAKDAGIKVVLASGRPRSGLQKYLEQLGLTTEDDFVVSFNGSLVERVESGAVLHQTSLKGTDIKATFEISQKLGVDIHAFSVTQGLITHRNNPWTDIEATLNNIESTEVDFNLIDDNEVFIKVMMVAAEDDLTAAIAQVPASLKEKYTVVRSAAIFLEVLHKDSNKGVAVEKLCQELNITAAEVMCVGDAENDHAMLAFAGMAVAMGNADDETKAMCHFITKTNLEDGVAVAIEEKALQPLLSTAI